MNRTARNVDFFYVLQRWASVEKIYVSEILLFLKKMTRVLEISHTMPSEKVTLFIRMCIILIQQNQAYQVGSLRKRREAVAAAAAHFSESFSI